MTNPTPQDPKQPDMEALIRRLIESGGPRAVADAEGDGFDDDVKSPFYKEAHHMINAADLGVKLQAYLMNYFYIEMQKETNPILRLRWAWIAGQFEVAGATMYGVLNHIHSFAHDVDDYRQGIGQGAKEYALTESNPATGILGAIEGYATLNPPIDLAGSPFKEHSTAEGDKAMWEQARAEGTI